MLDPELVAAASAAASTLPNCSLAESELLKQLRQHEVVTEAQKKGDMNNLGCVSSIWMLKEWIFKWDCEFFFPAFSFRIMENKCNKH